MGKFIHPVRKCRYANDMSQAETARQIGISKSYLSKIENGGDYSEEVRAKIDAFLARHKPDVTAAPEYQAEPKYRNVGGRRRLVSE